MGYTGSREAFCPTAGGMGETTAGASAHAHFLRQPTTASRKWRIGLDRRPFGKSRRPERFEEFGSVIRCDMFRHQTADLGGEFESMAAKADRDKQSVGSDPIQDRIGIGRHIVRAGPTASRLCLRHPRESFREARPDFPCRCDRERLKEFVVSHRLSGIRVHVPGERVFLAFGPRVRVPVEVEMDPRRWAEIERSSEEGDFPADVSNGQARTDGGHKVPRPIAGRDDDPLACQETLAANLDSRHAT